MPLLLFIKDLQFSLKGLDLILLSLDGFVVVDTVKLPFGNKDASLDLLKLYLLLLNLKSFLADKFILFLYLGQVDAVILLLSLITH